jgi:hypothetical protein
METIRKYISGKKYASSNVRSADGTIAYITSTGVSKVYPDMDVYNATAGKNNCGADFIQLTPNWKDLGFPVGTLMESGKSCGNEHSYVQATPPETNFDWQFYLQNNGDLGAAGITTESQATDHWNNNGKQEGRMPNATILSSMATLGKVGYIDVNATMHLVPPTYTGTYTSYSSKSNVTGINMEDCTKSIPPVLYGDQLIMVNKDLSGSMNASSLLEMGSTVTNLFLRPPVGMDLQGRPVNYGDQISITTSASSYTSDCGWWGCKVGRVNPTTKQLEFGPGGESAATFRIEPPRGSAYTLGTPIKYGDPFSFVVLLSSTNNVLEQDAYLSQGESITSSNGKYILVYQTDGNFCLYNTSGGGVWCSMAVHTPGQLVVQGDGNLVAYDSSGIPVWSTNTSGQGSGPYKLTVQNDRNVVLMDSTGTVLWSTQTTLDSTSSDITTPSVAFIKNSIVTFGTYKESKGTNVFSFKLQTNEPASCSVAELKKVCDESNCAGFIHSPASNTWQMITPTSSATDYAITNSMQDVYLKNARVDLHDASCESGEPQFIDSTLFANYSNGDDFVDGGTSQCEVIKPPVLPKNHKTDKMLKKGEEYVRKYNALNVNDLQTQNVNMQQDMNTKTNEYKNVLNTIKKTAKSGTLEQQKQDMAVFDDYNKNHAMLWGILATLILAFILFQKNKAV